MMINKMKNGLVPDYMEENVQYNRDFHNINTRYKNNFSSSISKKRKG